LGAPQRSPESEEQIGALVYLQYEVHECRSQACRWLCFAAHVSNQAVREIGKGIIYF